MGVSKAEHPPAYDLVGVSKAEHPPAYDLVGVAQRLERFPVEEEAGGPNPLTHPK